VSGAWPQAEFVARRRKRNVELRKIGHRRIRTLLSRDNFAAKVWQARTQQQGRTTKPCRVAGL
jgi:hypothetical protein